MSKLTPKVPKGPGSFTKFQMSQKDTQERPQAIRPQLPRDSVANGRPVHASGEMPKGGFQSIWAFGRNPTNTKESPTTKPGKKVY